MRVGLALIMLLSIAGDSVAQTGYKHVQFGNTDSLTSQSSTNTNSDLPPTIDLDRDQLAKLIAFLLKIHETYNNLIGSTLFRWISHLFDATGIGKIDHCSKTMAQLPTMTGKRADFVKEMLRQLQPTQAQGVQVIASNMQTRFRGSKLGEMFQKDRDLLYGTANVVATRGVLDCVLVAILDTSRLIAYAAFFGITFVSFFLLFLKLKAAVAFAIRLGASFFIPPVYFASVVFIFYLFYQREIDPVIAAFKIYFKI